MRILTLNANLKSVGTYRRCFYFSRELARAGHEVTMATVSRSSRWRAKTYFKKDWIREYEQASGEGPWVRVIEGAGLGYKWLPGWGSGPLDIGRRIREAAFGGYDAIYAFEYQPNVSWPVYLTRPVRKYRFFSDWCDWHAGQSNRYRDLRWAHRIDAFLEERIRFLAAKVTVTSQSLYDRALSIGLSPERVVQVTEGVDTDYIRAVPTAEARAALRIPNTGQLVLCGHDGDMKKVVRILKLVLESKPEAGAMILGKLSPEVKLMAQEAGIAKRIVFAGWVSDEDYPRYMAAADLSLLPLQNNLLNHARFPAKIVDFLAAGRPVVTNNAGQAGLLVKNGAVGLIAEEDDAAMALAVERLLECDEMRLEMGERARALMVSQWEWRTRGAKIAGIVAPAQPDPVASAVLQSR
jgi:glycosyltransferase involved in cell wall biosynthesis